MEIVKTKSVPNLGTGYPDGEGPNLIIYGGFTTADGNVAGLTIIDNALAAMTSKVGLMLWITSGAAAGQVRTISIHAANTLTVDVGFAAQILAGVTYIILPFYSGLAELDLVVPAPDVATNLLERDVIGNKEDAAVIVPDLVSSIIAYAKGILIAVGLINLENDVPAPDVATNLLERDVIGNKEDAAVTTVGVVASIIAYTKGILNQIALVIAGRQRGVTQVFQTPITSAANAGAVILATVTTQACLIKAITLKAVTAAQVDLTSAAITGGAAGVITFISAVTAAKVNITNIDQQVGWTGIVELAAGKTVVVTLVGTGATPVNLLVTIEYESVVNGGYLS